jgi:hypothetical protein
MAHAEARIFHRRFVSAPTKALLSLVKSLFRGILEADNSILEYGTLNCVSIYITLHEVCREPACYFVNVKATHVTYKVYGKCVRNPT